MEVYYGDAILGFTPFIAATNGRIAHAFNVDRGPGVHLTSTLDGRRLRWFNSAGALRSALSDSVIALRAALDVNLLVLHTSPYEL